MLLPLRDGQEWQDQHYERTGSHYAISGNESHKNRADELHEAEKWKNGI